MTPWTIDKYLLLAEIIECSNAEAGTNFEIERIMKILNDHKFDITEQGLRNMFTRNACFGGRGPQKLRGCPLKEGGKCGFIPSTTWSRR